MVAQIGTRVLIGLLESFSLVVLLLKELVLAIILLGRFALVAQIVLRATIGYPLDKRLVIVVKRDRLRLDCFPNLIQLRIRRSYFKKIKLTTKNMLYSI